MRHQQDWTSLQIVLNSGKYVTYPNEDGYFELYFIFIESFLIFHFFFQKKAIIFHQAHIC